MSSSPKPEPAETWIVNASPIITMAKAGQLRLFDRLASVVIPGAVADEILNGPPSDPARKALESGWGRLASPAVVPEAVLEWGLGAGESAVLALALERPDAQRFWTMGPHVDAPALWASLSWGLWVLSFAPSRPA